MAAHARPHSDRVLRHALEWMSAQPGVSAKHLAVVGVSRGGGLALLLSATFLSIRAVVAYLPSGIVWPAYPPSCHGAWTLSGKEIPYADTLSCDPWRRPSSTVIKPSKFDCYLVPLEDADHAARTSIPVEHINGPALLIVGAGRNLTHPGCGCRNWSLGWRESLPTLCIRSRSTGWRVARSNPDLNAASLLRRLAEVSPNTAAENYNAIHTGSLSEHDLREKVHWLDTRERRPVSVQGSEHHVELRLDDGFNHHAWILFDDLWASSHPELALSILRFSGPLDVNL
ncbi:acyl-CoA thioester hydrolase/BAAT C-terminal domain-containing protein [Variovorax paradoxus]|uniref:acyl-CoA thioester hydrolase/BAAT C-terminal domain-containing protein n=1 Tax=Variovorax paradoxus TaxID=34073 RepID=UPI0039B03CB6